MIIELNGAVDFDDPEYSYNGTSIYHSIAQTLNLYPCKPIIAERRFSMSTAVTQEDDAVMEDEPRSAVGSA
jgi:hypothetical protein